MPAGPPVTRGALLPRFFKICYLAAIAVAMVGWLSAFGWLAVRITLWLLA